MSSRAIHLTTACLVMLLIVQLPASPVRSALSVGSTPSSDGRSIASQGSPPRPNAAPLAQGLKHVGSFGGVVDTIAVTGTVALLGEGDGITVLDIHDSAKPTLVTRRLLPALVRHIEIVERLAFVGYGDDRSGIGGLQIFDLNNPISPTLKANYPLNKAVIDLQVVGSVAYLAVGGCPYFPCFDGPGNLQIVDVSDPSHPALRSSYAYGTVAESIRVVGGQAYLGYSYCAYFYYTYFFCGYGGIMIFDVANPNKPLLLSKSELNAPGYAIDVAEGLAYIAAGFNGLTILDVTNPRSPKPRSHLPRSIVGEAQDVQVIANRAYIANSDVYTGGLRVLDLHAGTTPTLLSTIETAPQAFALHVLNNLAYLASRETGLHIVDIATPAAPSVLGRYAAVGKVGVLRQASGRLYLSGGDGSLNALSIIDPTSSTKPPLIGRYGSPMAQGFTSLEIAGDFAYGTDGGLQSSNEMSIIDISNPMTPTLRGIYPSSAHDLAVTGNTAYLAKYGGLDILDIGDRAHPLLQTVYPMTTTFLTPYTFDARQIEVIGARAYVADQYKEFDILDITAPASPTLLGTYHVAYAEALRHIAVEGQFVYGAYERHIDPDQDFRGVEVVDVTDPLSPTLRGRYEGLQGFVEDLEVVGDRLYVTTYDFTSSSIMILDVSDPDAPRPIAALLFPAYLDDIVVDGDLLYVASEDSGIQLFQIIDLPFHVWLPTVQDQGF